MRRTVVLFAGLVLAAALPATARVPADPPAWAPKFTTQEIDTGLSIGYAVLVADLTGDQKPDVLVVDQLKVVVYESPTWKKHVILDGKTKPDNVCATTLDVDGDGKLDVVLGAGWKPSDTENPGTLQWLKNPGTLDREWQLFPIPCDEPTVHRVRAVDLDGDGKPEVVHVPLQGRGATPKGNYTDGRPVRVMAYAVPKEPTKPEGWKPRVLSEELYVVHNFTASGDSLLFASYDGLHSFSPRGRRLEHLGTGNQSNPAGNRGSSEVASGAGAIATIEPWHGNQVVTYRYTLPGQPFERTVIDDRLRWGHAVKMADLDGDRWDEIVVGVRDDPAKGDAFTERRGVRIYKNVHATPASGQRWDRFVLEDGGVAVEDLAVADLDGDGRKDIVACGRQTKNVRIYWNKGK